LANSERGEIANACGAAVLVEIHLNAAVDPEMNYSHAFWGEKEKDYSGRRCQASWWRLSSCQTRRRPGS
jgi:N-acetylmuramoyl-L-alanine amidase